MKLIQRFLILSPFFCLFFIFFWPLALLKKSFTLSDYSVQHLPWAMHAYEAARANALPIWTNFMTNGFPLFAEGQCASLYFWNFFAYRVMPFMAAYTYSILFHFLVGFAGMLLYARKCGISARGGVIAGVAFCFSSSYAGCFYNTGSLRTLCWLPVLLWLGQIIRDKSRFCGAAFFIYAAVVCQMWVAGFPQMAVYAFGYAVLHEMLSLRKKNVMPFIWVVSALVLGMFMAWPQISPTLELVRESVRQGESASFALWGSIPPVAPVSLLFPQWGNAMRVSFYIGFLPFFLVMVYVMTPKEARSLKHIFLAGFFFLLALGKYNPAYRWVIETFSLTSMRNPSKFLFFCVTSLSVLAGYGYDALKNGAISGDLAKRLRRLLFAITAITVALPFGAGLFLRFFEPFWPSLSRGYIERLIQEKGVLAKSWDYYQAQMDLFYASLVNAVSLKNWLNWQSVFLALACFFLIAGLLRKKYNSKFFYFLSALILIWDLSIFGFHLGSGFIGNAGFVRDLKPSAAMTLLIDEYKENPGLTAEIVKNPLEELFYPNASMAYGIRHAGGYSPLLLRNYYELVRELGIADSSLGRQPLDFNIWKNQRAVIDLCGILYIHSDLPLDWPSTRLVKKEGAFYLYENETALPLISFYSQWKTMERRGERLQYIKSGNFDPARDLILEEFFETPPAANLSNSSAEFKVKGADFSTELIFDARLSSDGFILTRLSAYPGWQVWVDGQKTPWIRAQHAFMAFWITQGEHRVELKFESSGWRRDWLISFVSVSLALIAAILIQFLSNRGYNTAQKI